MNTEEAEILKGFVNRGIHEDEAAAISAERSVNQIYSFIYFQIDKKPEGVISEKMDNGYISVTGECPVCWNNVCIANNYCSVCGQKLDWTKQREELKRTRGYDYA